MTENITTLIVDDEPPARDELEYLLSAHDDIEIIGTAANADEAVQLVDGKKPDLVFLDIQMPGQNGFQALERICELDKIPMVIFATAYDEYAIRAFEENAVDYILKPVSRERLSKSLERVREMHASSAAEPAPQTADETLRKLLTEVGIKPGITRISVEHCGRNMLLGPREIIYFDYHDRRVHAVTAEGQFCCQSDLTLDRIEERLRDFPFFRANRSQLVNLSHVRSYAPWFNGKYVLNMNVAEETEIIVSKARVKEFRAAIEL